MDKAYSGVPRSARLCTHRQSCDGAGPAIAKPAAALSARNYRRLFAEAAQAMWVCERVSGRFLTANAAAAALCGFACGELQTMRAEDLFFGDRLPGLPAECDTDVAWTCRCRHRTGRELDMSVVSHPLELGDIRAVLVTAVPDLRQLHAQLAERTAAEEQALRMNAELSRRVLELRDANRELEAFARAAAHDLRSPLRSIAGFAHLLQEQLGEDLDPHAREHLGRITRGVARMEALVADLLLLTRRPHAPLDRRPVDLSALAGGVVEELRAAEPQRPVRVEIAPGLRAHGDAGLLRAAIANLIGNAWKFTRGRADAHIEFASTGEGAESIFHVRDNGVGFEATSASDLFAEFVRLPNAEAFEGIGVGLANVQRIVRHHGGRIWAQGQLNTGATFFFTLP